jgi:hypothetical protein
LTFVRPASAGQAGTVVADRSDEPMRYCVVDDRAVAHTTDRRPAGDLAIADAVGLGCTNRRDDVLVVQSLLNVAYARIRVPSRTIPVDGLVGQQTHAAILHFQRDQVGGAGGGRVEPAGRTLFRLNAVAAGPPRAAGTARAASVASPLDLALDASALAREWAGAARRHVDVLRRSPGSTRRRSSADRFVTVNTHFHLDRDASCLPRSLVRLASIFARIEEVLSAAADVIREAAPLAASTVVEAPIAGVGACDAAARTITVRPGLAVCGPNTRAALILHACAHVVGGADEIEHFALEFPAPDGSPHERGCRNYRELTPAEALCNAASYTAFAIHAATGSDQRFGARDPRL